jgi:TolB-like protein/Tfp pilus assembly protein PilF
MDVANSQPPPDRAPSSVSHPLGSWKEIAAYLKRDERTVRRWEKEGLPVHRHLHKKQASVYAFRSELDAWWQRDRVRLEAGDAATKTQHHRFAWLIAVAAVALPIALVGFNVGGLQERLFSGHGTVQIGSIAVLPLKNLSSDREQDYFADGMTEALITQLGKITALDVISHQSILGYRGGTKPLPDIARELNVKAVVEGTVLRSGDKVRITANLVQAAPERHLWAESYEVDRRDILAVQEQVARQVVSHIRAKLTPDEQRRLSTVRSVDPEAYEAYLLGRAYLYKPRTAMNAVRAKESFEKAIEKDSKYAPAYASLAELYIWTGGAGSLTIQKAGFSEAHALARKWAEKAIELDEQLADAHNALAMVKQAAWDWTGATREYRRAIELNPSHAVARISYAMHLCALQDFEEAATQARRAQQLDPASPFINSWAAAVFFYAGSDQAAFASVQKVIELEPGYEAASLVLGRTYVSRGRYQEAITEFQRGLSYNRRNSGLVAALAHAYARSGNRQRALELVDEVEQAGRPEQGEVPTFHMVWAYAGLGDNDQAFAWLERAYQERRQRLTWLNADPLLEPLRPDPRFADLVRRVGLPSAAEIQKKN